MFKHHGGAITSVEWHPEDSTVFASAGEDDQVSRSESRAIFIEVQVYIFYG